MIRMYSSTKTTEGCILLHQRNHVLMTMTREKTFKLYTCLLLVSWHNSTCYPPRWSRIISSGFFYLIWCRIKLLYTDLKLKMSSLLHFSYLFFFEIAIHTTSTHPFCLENMMKRFNLHGGTFLDYMNSQKHHKKLKTRHIVQKLHSAAHSLSRISCTCIAVCDFIGRKPVFPVIEITSVDIEYRLICSDKKKKRPFIKTEFSSYVRLLHC